MPPYSTRLPYLIQAVKNHDNPNACLEWPFCRQSDGYGSIWLEDHMEPVHRETYRRFRGRIPKGKCVCHHCDNPACFNPAHLFLGTHADNMRDKAQKDRVNHPVQLGEKNNAHKLTEQQVREIRRRYIPRDPKNGQYALGREFGVNHSTIWAVLKGLNWKDVH